MDGSFDQERLIIFEPPPLSNPDLHSVPGQSEAPKAREVGKIRPQVRQQDPPRPQPTPVVQEIRKGEMLSRLSSKVCAFAQKEIGSPGEANEPVKPGGVAGVDDPAARYLDAI